MATLIDSLVLAGVVRASVAEPEHRGHDANTKLVKRVGADKGENVGVLAEAARVVKLGNRFVTVLGLAVQAGWGTAGEGLTETVRLHQHLTSPASSRFSSGPSS